MRTTPLLVLALLGFGTVGLHAQQSPGAYPHMILVDADGMEVPPASGPFDNSNVFTSTAGQAFSVRLSYAAAAQPNDNVPWALLASALPTPFPTDIVPPPLYTLPPFELIFPAPFFLDAGGQGQLALTVPTGLFGIELYLQAIIEDTTNVPNLQLSNGSRMVIEPPDFNVRFSFVRAVPALGTPDLQGVATIDIDGSTLKTHPPLGTTTPPTTEPDDIGLPAGGFLFRPIVANVADAPVNPLARPVTKVSQSATANANVIFVEDTRFFPSQGFLYIATGNSNLFAEKAGGQANPPAVEVVNYGGKTATSFTQLRRKLLGSAGAANHPHVPGELILGDFSMATTSGAQRRTRIGLDATNADTPHVVLPAFTFDGPEGTLTMDLDIYRYETTAGNVEGFCVFDHVTQSWRLIEGTEVASTPNLFWDAMVAFAPDRRSMLATVRVNAGPSWFSAPDELWAIRLDGLTWPATGTQAWKIDFAPGPDPAMDAVTVASRRVHMPSVAIIGPDPDNYVGFVGLGHKYQQSNMGNNNFPDQGFEGFWAREEVIVNDYIDVPLVPPGSSKPAPPAQRTSIEGAFPATGGGNTITRFDPVPLVAADKRSQYISAGPVIALEDLYRVRNVGINGLGEVTKQIANISGYGAPGGNDDGVRGNRAMDRGGHGWGGKAAVSPGGTRIAYVRDLSTTRDFLNVIRTSGADYAQAKNFTLGFTSGTDFGGQHVVAGIRWYDEDTLFFLMGRNAYDNPLNPVTDASPPGYEIFSYTVSTNTIVRRTHTQASGGGSGALGTILPAATFVSENGQYYYVVRDGRLPHATASRPSLTPILNVMAVHMPTGLVLDVTGDEFAGNSLVGSADLPDSEQRTPVETAAVMRWMEGSGANAGLMYFVAHTALDPTLTDELFGFNREQPIVAFQATSGTPAGAHVSNVTPNPYSASVAFARTFGSDPFANAQHPFVVDLDNFLFLRDLTPDVALGGAPFGRVMDGSFHFVAPSSGAGDALVFAMGSEVQLDSEGIAQRTAIVYYPLTNLSDTLAEPTPLLLPLVTTLGLGPGFRLYVVSAEPSTR